MRAIEHVDFEGVSLVGTHHLAAPGARRNIGVLVLNGGYVPRDGHAGLSVKICDALAERGFPSFRFDLPMLGDSPGQPPPLADEFFELIYRGDFCEPTLAIARELCRRHLLDGVILSGLCGGASTAIYAADRAPSLIVGLALLEPELYRATAKDHAPHENGEALGLAHKFAGKLFSYWGWMRLLTRENGMSRFAFLPREQILDLVLPRHKLPETTNIPLVGAFCRTVNALFPTLVVTAQGKLHEVFFDRITGVVLNGARRPNLTHLRVAGTNHTFTTGGAIEEVSSHVVDWATRTFPTPARDASTAA
jgi:hypothetical protein